VSDVLRELADERHTVRLTVEDGILSMKVLCPFDETDTERPCWPTDECLEPLPGPEQECVYIGWCENLTPEEFAAGMVSFDCAVRWDWSDGDGPQAELHEPPVLRSAADENDRLREALRECESVLARVRSDRPTAHSESVWQALADTRARALLAVPEPCAECRDRRWVAGFASDGMHAKVPCPVCAVPEPTEEA